MNLYIFENVLWDYTSGMVVIAARTLEDALASAEAEYGEVELERSEGWSAPTAVYPVGADVLPGIRHEVYGGS